jgi:OTU domain-containing protein 6
MSSLEELESAHKKAMKALEGEKRATIKKAKALKGKKSKDAMEAAEAEYVTKLQNLEASYQENLASLGVACLQVSSEEKSQGRETKEAPSRTIAEPTAGIVDEDAAERERKVAKARKKREKQKEQEAKIKEQIELENAMAGPSLRQVELEQMQAFLDPLNLRIVEVEADGHCLYRAVAAQSNYDYKEISRWYWGIFAHFIR